MKVRVSSSFQYGLGPAAVVVLRLLLPLLCVRHTSTKGETESPGSWRGAAPASWSEGLSCGGREMGDSGGEVTEKLRPRW